MFLEKIKKQAVTVLSLALVVACFVGSSLAQAGTSGVTGSVTDPQGQAIVGATVTLVSSGQGSRRTAISDNRGNFIFTSLQPGSYTIEVESAGFNRAVTKEFNALVDSVATVPVQLEIGDVSVSVTVDTSGIESIKNTSDASLGNNFISEQISQLPLEGRNVAALLSLQPGVTPGGYVAGGRSDQANITLDGVDVNNQQEGTAFTPVLRVTPDSIEEFRVTTSNPDASRGRSAGAQIALVTKSGSNQFRGNLFWYHRNDLFNANNWFNNAAGEPREKLLRNLFGGSLGGPIVKDRLFFFYNYEGMREAKSVSVNRLVPLASLGQGQFLFFDTSGTLRTIGTAQINSFTDPENNPVVDVNQNVVSLFAAAAARYPSNNFEIGDTLNTGGFRFNAPMPVEQDTHSAKFDWIVTGDQKHQVSLRMNYQQDIFGGSSNFPDTPATNRWSHPLGGALSHTWLINNNITNRFTYGLTRLAFSDQGDSGENAVTFRDIFSPFAYSRTFSRVNPTHNFANDTTWLKGNHTIQFGTNIRLIRNERVNWGAAYDSAVTNFGWYESGELVTAIVNRYTQATWGTDVSSAWLRSAQSPLVALLGRLNQYTARFNYDAAGNPQPNTPTVREFATEEYDFYVQDAWKVRPSLTVTLGLRYGYSTPVYETSGLEVAPNIALDTYFERRLQFAEVGLNYDEPITLNLSGKVNGRPPMYDKDKNNFQPRVAIAWSPNFDKGLGAFIFGRNRAGVLRGGFAVTNDYYGQQLAVSFDAANQLGFLTQYTRPANLTNLSTNPAPAWDGTPMNIQSFPGVTAPGQLVFPLTQPSDLGMRIERSIDRGIQAPINYSTNLTFGRELPKKLYLEMSYIGRKARNLLASRDVMAANNLRDPISGQTYYEAARIIAEHRFAGGSVATVPTVPFFENLWPQLNANFTNSQLFAAYAGNSTGWDWSTYNFDRINRLLGGTSLFYQTQYGALDSVGSIANSDYHAGTLSVRQRLSTFTWDFNYTYSHSMDDTSGLQTAGSFGTAFILNAIRQGDNYASSDFDMRHLVNFNGVWQIPLGRGRQFMSNANSFVDAVFGGWQLASIFRYNSGQPHGTGFRYFDNSGWATNWNLKSSVVQTRPLQTGVHFNGQDGLPTMWSDADYAYQSFRSPYPGETGDRNQLRWPAFWVVDLGLQKSFTMPWYEGHKVSLRWDVFNVTNTPIFAGNANTALGYLPQNGTAPVGFGQFTTTRSDARIMQFALRYDF